MILNGMKETVSATLPRAIIADTEVLKDAPLDKEHNLKHDEVVYIGDDYGLGGNNESVYKSDFKYVTIDNHRDFPKIIELLLN